MANIKPFKALRPVLEHALQVASRPYDVLNREEAKAEATANPYSFLHITKSEIDLPDDVDIHHQQVYDKAKQNLQKFRDEDVLIQEENACYYIYQLTMNGRSQTGLVCVSSIDDYFNDKIKKHEYTRPEKEKDRINHIKTTRAQTGNVFLACRDLEELDEIFEHWKHDNLATYNFTTADEIQHTIWIIDNLATIDSITALFEEKIPATYIADGHHRAASAAKVSKELSESNDAQYFLTTIFPAGQLAILDYNRVVKDLNGLSDSDFLTALEKDFSVSLSSEAVKPKEKYKFGMFLNGQWYKLNPRENPASNDPIGVLDISVLSEKILDKILNIKDQRTDKRIDFVGGIRGLEELEKRVNSGEMKVAFSLHPVNIQQLFDIADSGEVMPPKSTWFEPKLRDGLLTHLV
ncbi:MAG: DUF1015 domain-containing protein [Chitinophagaceae bacterium]|jgi:uncharacterized protein (DUF1015 family)|nr:DUF1015 domain-containing protein [Chitinophagaceae bacterium]